MPANRCSEEISIKATFRSKRGSMIIPLAEVTNKIYDFIVAGGGTAGCVLASRLSQNPNIKVLLIEAGGSAQGQQNTEVPFLGVTLPGSDLDWKFNSVPQAGLDGRSVPVARGQVLGGTSTINFFTWNRASNALWDKWASLTGDQEWSWKHVEKYYKMTSRLVKPADGHDTTGEIIPSAHGNGPIEVSVPGFPTELDSMVVNTSKSLGGRFAYNQDINAGKTLGFGLMQSSIGHSKRSSSATAYLAPAMNRPNLDVLINTHVTRLVRTSERHISVFRTIEVATSASGQHYQITAAKEIILSAGVIGTPQILLLSGIGPKEDLDKLNIITYVDIPDVGRNLVDHPLVPNYFSVNSDKTFDAVLRDPTIFAGKLQEWASSGQGLFVDSPGNTQGYMRLPKDAAIFERYQDPASSPESAHTEIIFVDGFGQFGEAPAPETGNFMTVLTGVVSPLSRGSVTLTSSDPFDKPAIDLGLLNSEFDIFAMVQAMKDAQSFLTAEPWSGYIKAPFGELADATTDEAKAAYARKFGVTGNHPAGTAAMSPAHAAWGVVDSKLLLKGVEGVRVVDASVFPHTPECHIQAPVYVIAERAADLIKEKYAI
ncbi:Pyranose dehydrogenase 1 [Hypsizygus marmoreus]|uniref:Pyranose dehydrogenase 1 n=1 Tax=Hypsizygus marmoreus TaxID=39966 RepID=A0A369JHW4_HYPMA|nr:Pyranose dehydrogenase 1 [Hypsizygus marmoreus]